MKTLAEIRLAQSKCSTAIAKELCENLRYFKRRISVKTNASLTAEDVKLWSNRIKMMLDEAYKIYFDCYTNGTTVENAKVDFTPVFDELKKLYGYIGDVTERKLYIDDKAAIIIVGYSHKATSEKSDELIEAENALKAAKADLEDATEENLAELTEKVEDAKVKVRELVKVADNKTPLETKQSENAFIVAVENYLAGAICGQAIKTPAELDAEAEARKEARKAKNKARRAEKRQAEKAAKAVTPATEMLINAVEHLVEVETNTTK